MVGVRVIPCNRSIVVDNIAILVNDEIVSISRTNEGSLKGEEPMEWSMDGPCVAFPADTIAIKVALRRFKLKPWSRLFPRKMTCNDDYSVSASDIIAHCQERSRDGKLVLDRRVEFPNSGSNSQLSVMLALQECNAANRRLKSNPSNEIDDFVFSSPDALVIRDILKSIGDSVDIVRKLRVAFMAATSVHPIVAAIVHALLIPYELLSGERDFPVDSLQLFVDEMYRTLLLVTESERMDTTRDFVSEVMGVILESAKYIEEFYYGNPQLKRLLLPQFTYQLGDFLDQLQDRRDAFREAITIESLIKAGELHGNGGLRYYLRDLLSPSAQAHPGDGCLEGTRVSVLSNIHAWSRNNDMPNICWIYGAAGIGKTSVLSSIARSSNRHSTFFFIRRDVEELRYPRSIWRTIAFRLASMFKDVELDLLDFLNGNTSYAQVTGVEDQFHNLIRRPLEKHYSSNSTNSLVVIIDALDELTSEGLLGDREAFLNTIVEWNKLPPSCKLIVSSRTHADVIEKLDHELIHHINLSTEHDLTESLLDMRLFLESRFQRLRSARGVEDLPASWPGGDTIDLLTKNSDGLFVWASTVMQYLESAMDPDSRLKELLQALVPEKSDPTSQIYNLYAEVLLAAWSGSGPEGAEILGDVLGSLAWSKSPIPLPKLTQFLTRPDGGRPLAVVKLERVIDSLAPVIYIQESDQYIIPHHPSFLRFLTDEAGAKATFRAFTNAEAAQTIFNRIHDASLTAVWAENQETPSNSGDLEGKDSNPFRNASANFTYDFICESRLGPFSIFT